MAILLNLVKSTVSAGYTVRCNKCIRDYSFFVFVFQYFAYCFPCFPPIISMHVKFFFALHACQFYACSYDVKCYLFRSYISTMYCGQFWFNSTKFCLNKLRVSYNNSCRRLLGLPMRNSASGMFVQCNLLSFGERLRKSIFAFRGRIQSSNNIVIKCMVNSVAPLVSNVWKWWRTTLYTGHVTV